MAERKPVYNEAVHGNKVSTWKIIKNAFYAAETDAATGSSVTTFSAEHGGRYRKNTGWWYGYVGHAATGSVNIAHTKTRRSRNIYINTASKKQCRSRAGAQKNLSKYSEKIT